jgi:hypothetical protein
VGSNPTTRSISINLVNYGIELSLVFWRELLAGIRYDLCFIPLPKSFKLLWMFFGIFMQDLTPSKGYSSISSTRRVLLR